MRALTAKQIDKRIEKTYYARCNRIPVNVMDIPKIFAVGRKAIAAGADDQALGDAIAAFVETIRVNH